MPGHTESEPAGGTLSAAEIACLTGVSVTVLHRIVRFELVSSATPPPDLRFDPAVLPQVRRLRRLHEHLGVGWSSMALVLDLPPSGAFGVSRAPRAP